MNDFFIPGDRIILRIISKDLIPEIVRFYERNMSRILCFNSKLPDVYLTENYWLKQYRYRNTLLRNDKSMDFYICLPDRKEKVVGHIRIFNIESSPRSTCEIGFSIDELLEGRGYMAEAILLALPFINEGLNIHRVTAQCHPNNIKSRKLLKTLGFSEEGVLHEALSINNVWQDMILYYMILWLFDYTIFWFTGTKAALFILRVVVFSNSVSFMW